MSDTSIFTDPAEPPDADQELADIEELLDQDQTAPPLTPATQQPLGRSYAYDFTRKGFVPYGAGPLQTTGLDTLRYWVEKCLLTARGAHPVYSDAYGVDDPTEQIGEPLATAMASDLRDVVQEALQMHPRIDGIANFSIVSDPDDDYLLVSFDVLVSGGEGVLTLDEVQVGE